MDIQNVECIQCILIKRLLGDSMYKISQEKITDRKMNNLRKILYRI